MKQGCKSCQLVEGRQWGRRVYADALVLVLLARGELGRRELWVLPRRHTETDDLVLRAHGWKVAERAAAALADAGIPFAVHQGRWTEPETDPEPGNTHARLCVPEESHGDDSGVFRLPPVEPAGKRAHLRSV